MLGMAMLFTGVIAAGAQATDRRVDGFPELPKDARAVAERAISCEHFAGEINGDGSSRDREVMRRMRTLKCDAVQRDQERMRVKYRQHPEVIRVLDTLPLS